MDVEQPTPADVNPSSTFEGIEEPDELIEDAAVIEAWHQGKRAAAFHKALVTGGVKRKHAYNLTSQWMGEND